MCNLSRRTLLFTTLLYVGAVQAASGDETATAAATQPSEMTGNPRSGGARYGTGFEARQESGGSVPDGRVRRAGLAERSERIERIERFHRIERIERGRGH